ncbi:hypothetical protein DFP73DRAFT_546263 [Morchella snyderi]|nr:hypothetical protein DFP73DRAFT_546263 [Morchella snyderi]
MGSLRHNPLIEELKCITGSECKKIFTSPSGVLHHLECGACKSGIDRRKLDQLIKEKDTECIITFDVGPDEEIQNNDDVDEIAEGEQKCPKCSAARNRTFKTAYALQQHMKSAAHAPLSYHCPVTLAVGRKGVLKSFTTFSGMTQHLESGACKGGKLTFVKAMNIVNRKLREHGLGEMKLIP